MKNVLIIIFILLCVFLTVGCQSDNIEEKDIVISNYDNPSSYSSSGNPENETVCYSEEHIFASLEEMADYLGNSTERENYVLSSTKQVEIYSPKSIPNGYDLKYIRLNGSYITYHYKTEDYIDSREEKSVDGNQNSTNKKTPSISHATEQNTLQKELDELGQDEFIKKYGLSSADIEEIQDISTTIKMEWAFKANDGKKLLENSKNMFSLIEMEALPGYFYYPVIYPGTSDIIAYRIFWEENNICFAANVPITVINNMTRNTNGFKLEFQKEVFHSS